MIARWSLALALFAWFLFAAGWGALHLLIVPRIGELRPQLEAAASRLMGVPVRIEAVAAYSTGMIPAFELRNVSLHDTQGREALRLPRVLVSLSPRSALSLKFNQVYIDHPTLNVRRAVDGTITVAGLDPSKGVGGDSGLLGNLFSQPELVIRRGAIVWSDELRAVAPLELRDVDVVLRNHGRRHDLRVDATPPADWGARFGLVAKFEQPFLSMDNGRWQEWSGQAYAAFAQVDVSQLQRYADLGVDMRQGRGAARAWFDIQRGRVVAGTADVALADVQAQLGPALAPLQLRAMSGRMSGRRTPGTLEFATQELAFDTADGLHWPGGNLRLTQGEGDAARPARGELVADRLDLAALAQIAGRLPLGDAVHSALSRYAPRGLVDRVSAKWQGHVDAMQTYELQARVQQLHVRAGPAAPPPPGAHPALGSPGITGATVDLDFSESSGKAKVSVQNGSITVPGVFDDPLVPLSQLSTDVAWQMDGARIKVQLPNLRFANADTDGELQLTWQTSDPARSAGASRFPGVLDMHGNLSRADASRVYRYLPLLLSERVRDYVRGAVLAGAGSGVKFKVRGDLHDMPFANPKHGEFLITAAVRNATMVFVPRRYQGADAPPWPVFTQLAGELVFDRKSMRINGVRGNVVGLPALQLVRADGGIADMTHGASVGFTMEARGPLTDMLGVVNGSPLGLLTGSMLARTTASGNAELRLKAELPLDALEKSTLQGTVALPANDLLLFAEGPRLTRARGTVAFSESGFSVNGLQARMLGGDMRLDGGTLPAMPAAPTNVTTTAPPAPRAANLAFRVQGSASVDAVRQARELGFVSRLAQFASGSAAYTAALSLRGGTPEFSLSSNLVGLALNLPAPLGKSADAALPLSISSVAIREPPPAAPPLRGRPRDQLTMELGRAVAITYVRDVSGAEPRVVHGAIAVGLGPEESAPMPEDGVAANIKLGTVDVDAWSAVLAQLAGASTANAGTGPAAVDADAGGAARDYFPTSLAVRAQEIGAWGRKLHHVVAGVSRAGPVWRVNVDADELDGYVEYAQPVAAGAGRVFARLSRLTLAQGSASDVEALLDEQPASIPALDIVVDELELRGKKLGRVEIEAVNRGANAVAREGGIREWRLNKFNILTPEAVFKVNGNWAASGARDAQGASTAPAQSPAEARRTAMEFRLDIENSGELLARFGIKDVMRRGKGSMEGKVAWAGSPLSIDFPSLSGAFNVHVDNGQFLKADPGLAKLLGVLSLQSLPRRLALDFRDVFTEGFAFDYFRGDVQIERGIARSHNLQMRGVNAAVFMDGTADLAQETQDLKVVVVPEINAGTASLIATAINPALGLGSFLAQLFLRRPLIEAATQEFHIDGGWLDPRITRVSRRLATPNAADDSPAGRNTGEVQ